MLEGACMREEPNPVPQDNNVSPSQGAPVANMGMGPTNMGQASMGQDLGQNMAQANMTQLAMGQANMGQGNIGQEVMGQSEMGQGGMAQNVVQAKYEPLDINIDPNIGIQQIGGMGPAGNVGSMGAAPGRGMSMQGGQMRGERIDEMPQEM